LAQERAGWLYLEGYPDRVVEKNTVTVEVPREERDTIIEEPQGRNGQVACAAIPPDTEVPK